MPDHVPFLLYPYLLAFIIAVIVAYLELEITLYPNTRFLIKKYKLLFCYLSFYGFIGIVSFWLFIFTGASVTLQNKIVESLYVQAIVIGVISKGISDLNFFKVPFGTETQSIGIKTFTEPIQKAILTRIDQEESNSLREYVTTSDICCKNSNDALTKIQGNLPVKASKPERIAYKEDVCDLWNLFDDDSEIRERYNEHLAKTNPTKAAEMDKAKKNVALEKFLKDFGKRTFDRVFKP